MPDEPAPAQRQDHSAEPMNTTDKTPPANDQHAALGLSASTGSALSYRALKEGEIVLATDEIYDDHRREWVEPIWSVGKPAPNPAYTSHRQFRRLVSAMPND